MLKTFGNPRCSSAETSKASRRLATPVRAPQGVSVQILK